MKVLPYYLTKAYGDIYRSNIVKYNEISDTTINEFITILNSAIPNEEKNNKDLSLYYFIKEKFYNNKYKFIKDFNEIQYKCLILWTDYNVILNHFKLKNKIVIYWSRENKEYKGYINEQYNNKTVIPSTFNEYMKLDTKEIKPVFDKANGKLFNKLQNNKEPSQEFFEDNLDDEGRLRQIMKSRREALEKNIF